MEELETLGCRSSDESCLSSFSWVYGTSYWSGVADASNAIWAVYSEGDLDVADYSSNSRRGCRPVIVISKSLF